MNKFVRFLILSIVLLVLILTSMQDTDSPSGFVGSSDTSIATPLVAREKSAGQHGLILIEFFAGN